MERKILKNEERVLTRLPNPATYQANWRKANTRRLNKYINEHQFSDDPNIRERVSLYQSYKNTITSLPPYVTKSKPKVKIIPLLPAGLVTADSSFEESEEFAEESAAAEAPAAPAPAAEELRSTTTDDIPVIIVEKQLALKDCQKRCKEISDDIRKLQSDNIMSEINLLGLSLDAKIVDLLVYRILDPSTEWKRNIEFLIDIPNDITGSLLKGGSYFEALFHLLFAINYYPKFQDNTLEFLQIEKYKVPLPFKADDGSRDYLYGQSILSAGGKSDIQGISDITFKVLPKNKSSDDTVDDSYKCGERPKKREDNINPHYFFSVKGFRKEKSVAKDYDIPILSQQASILQGIKNPKICVGVRDKDDFMRHLNRTKIVFIKETLSEIIIGFDEMMNYFDKFRQNFFLRFGKSDNIDERRRQVEELYPRNQIILPQLNLHYHQELVSEAVINSIKSKDLGVRKKPHFMCIGVLPRGGKSFIAGGVIRKHRELLKKKTGYNVLFLTSAVTETISQFKDDLVNKFADFRDITFVDARTDKPSINNFVFISRQLASISIKKGDEIVIDLFNTLIKKGINLSYDIIFFDEAHIGILSVIQQENFKKAFNNFKIPIVLMTATYIKPANVLDDNRDLFVWDLFDIKDMRQLPTNGADVFKTNTIASRYGDLAYKILSDRINVGESLASIAKPYEKFPMPSFVSPMFSKQTLAKLQYFDYDSFFKMKSLSLDEKNKLNDVRTWREWDAFLNNREQALMLRNYLTPKDNELANPSMIIQERDKALIQVFKRAYNNEPPTRPLYGQPFSVLMFMPSIKGNPVGALCRIWGSFLMKTKFWSDYFVCLTLSPLSEGDEDKGRKSKKSKEDMREYELGCWKQGFCTRDIVSEKDLKKMITTIEREALNEDKGLLLLTGEVAKMGISLPCVDVVFLLSNNNDSADDLIQKMFRSLTDSDGKKLGFVVDINLKRIIKAMFEYDLAKDKIRLSGQPKTTEERVKNILEMCDWGQDEFIEDNSSTMNYEDIMKAIKDKVFSNLELLTISTKVLQNEALSELLKDDDIRRELFNNMKKTVKVKTKATVLGVRGEGVPNKPPSSKDDNNEPAENTDEGVEEEDNHEPDEEEGVSNSISAKEKKHFEDNFKSLIITFINSLIVRNGRIEWKQGVRLMDLLDTFKIDSSKARPSVECACIDKSSCNEHMNLYERVFCDVKTYSLDKTADKVSALINAIYNFIMKHRELQVTLQSYIDTFIDEIEGNKQRLLSGGGRKTLKKKRSPM